MTGRFAWQVTAASQAGTSHLRRGEACADAFSLAAHDSGVIVAVADGAGSSRYGAAGAAAAVEISTRLALARFASEGSDGFGTRPLPLIRGIFEDTLAVFLEAADRARSMLAEAGPPPPADAGASLASQAATLIAGCIRRISGPGEAGTGALELRQLHTTLLLAALHNRGLSVGNIGDGWLAARDTGGAIRAVAPPAPSEYANETFFLDSEGALEAAAYECIAGGEVDALAVFTDGAASFAIDFSSATPSVALLRKLFAFASDRSATARQRDSDLAAFLGSERICRHTDDDKTIVLAVRVPPDDTE